MVVAYGNSLYGSVADNEVPRITENSQIAAVVTGTVQLSCKYRHLVRSLNSRDPVKCRLIVTHCGMATYIEGKTDKETCTIKGSSGFLVSMDAF